MILCGMMTKKFMAFKKKAEIFSFPEKSGGGMFVI